MHAVAVAFLLLLVAVVAAVSAAPAPFRPVWNAPTSKCWSACPGAELRPSQYGVATNPKMRFYGPEMTLLYDVPFPRLEGKLDATPCWAPGHGRNCSWQPWGSFRVLRNGGVPQAANLTEHILGVEAAVEKAAPNANYSGMLLIDWEAWRVPFDSNYDWLSLYQDYSRNLVAAEHPEWNATQINAEAEAQFNAGGKAIFLATVETMKRMRPNASVGFYAYPYRDVDVAGLPWLWDALDVVLCSAYARGPTESAGDVIALVSRAASRGVAVRALHPHIRVYPYVLDGVFLDEPAQPFTPGATTAAIVAPAVLGADGVVLWGSSATVEHGCDGCAALQKSWAGAMGPTTAACRAEVETCSIERCGGKGRCALAGPLNVTAALNDGCALLRPPTPIQCLSG